MWNYEKRLQYPVKITQTNPKIAQIILSQFGGPDGELGASLRYFSQRYTMPYNEVIGTLTDIATEEFAHMEIVCAIVHQLTRNLTPEQLEKSGFDNIMLTIHLLFGHRLPVELLGVLQLSSLKVTLSQIFMKIWLPNKKPVLPMIIFCVLLKILKSVIRSDSFANVKLFIINVLEKASELSRIN